MTDDGISTNLGFFSIKYGGIWSFFKDPNFVNFSPPTLMVVGSNFELFSSKTEEMGSYQGVLVLMLRAFFSFSSALIRSLMSPLFQEWSWPETLKVDRTGELTDFWSTARTDFWSTEFIGFWSTGFTSFLSTDVDAAFLSIAEGFVGGSDLYRRYSVEGVNSIRRRSPIAVCPEKF